MDLDGAKQDAGWRTATDPNAWAQYSPFGQHPAYTYSSTQPRLSSNEQLNPAVNQNFGSVKNRVAELLTSSTAISQLYPEPYLDSRQRNDLSRSMSLSHSSGIYPENLAHNPGGRNPPIGYPPEMVRSASMSHIEAKKSVARNSDLTNKLKDRVQSKIQSTLSHENVKNLPVPQHYEGGNNLKSFMKESIDHNLFSHNHFGKMANTSAIYPPSQSYKAFPDITQHKLANLHSNFPNDFKPFGTNRQLSSESNNSDSSRSSFQNGPDSRLTGQHLLDSKLPFLTVNDPIRAPYTNFTNAQGQNSEKTYPVQQTSALQHGSHSSMMHQHHKSNIQQFNNPPVSNNKDQQQVFNPLVNPFNFSESNSLKGSQIPAGQTNNFFNPIASPNLDQTSNPSPRSFQSVESLIENHQPAVTKSASRSWSPWDNLIRSNNSSPATVTSTTSSSQPTSPIINYSPVPSPFSSSSSSLGSHSIGLPSTTSLGSAVPTSASPSLAGSPAEPEQQRSKDPFQFQDETNPMKPPEALPKTSKTSKKKTDGRLKECRRKKGVLPFPDMSLDEINPELAKMIRESKMKEELKSKKKESQNGEKPKKLPIYAPRPSPPSSSLSPINSTTSFLNNQMNSVMKPTSPYEFSDEPEDFSTVVLKDTFNSPINVNSKMYSMSEMLAMTNTRSDIVDTKSCDAKSETINGEVKKKKKKKKTVEKMLASPNTLNTTYPIFQNEDFNSAINNQSNAASAALNSISESISLDNSSAPSLQINSRPQDNVNIQNTNSNHAFSVKTPSGNNLHHTMPVRTVDISLSAHGQNNELMKHMDKHASISQINNTVTSFSNQNHQLIGGIGKNHVLGRVVDNQTLKNNFSQPEMSKSKFCCTDCKHTGNTLTENCPNHLKHKHSAAITNQVRQSESVFVAKTFNPNLKSPDVVTNNSATFNSLQQGGQNNIINGPYSVQTNMYKPEQITANKFAAGPLIKSEHVEMDLDQYLQGFPEPNSEGALLNNLEASIHSLFTKTDSHESVEKVCPPHHETMGTLKRSSSWHDLHSLTKKKKISTNKFAKKNPLLDPNMKAIKAPKIKKVKLNGLTKAPVPPPRIGPPLTPEEELLDRLKNNRQEFSSCTCVSSDIETYEVDGPYYTQLGCGKTIQSVREKLEKTIGCSGEALRIEKVNYSGKEGKSSQGCPIAKWIIRRGGPEEKYLCVLKKRRNHFCEATYIVINLVAWEGVEPTKADDLYTNLVSTLTVNGFETERRCGTNEKKTCACQGVDLVRRGASFSFGCSWSMYFNGCKYARSQHVRKFKLKDTSKEEVLESRLQSLASDVGPLYEIMAPDAHRNQCELKEGKECRLGDNEKKPFSGVTACVDFCAHSHKDLHNMNNGSTVVVTLTKHRGFDKADDEQLHVLPLYTLDPTDEHGSYDNQMEKVRKGALEILENFPHEARMRSQPLTPKKKGRNAKKDQSPNHKKEREAMNSILAMKAKLNRGPLDSKFSQIPGKIAKVEKENTPSVKSEGKDSLTFDNLMALQNTPGFADMYESFWSHFYTNGTFPSSDFLQKWGVKVPPNQQNGFKQDVNNPSNTLIQKPSSEMSAMNNQLKNNVNPLFKTNLQANHVFGSDKGLSESFKNPNGIHQVNTLNNSHHSTNSNIVPGQMQQANKMQQPNSAHHLGQNRLSHPMQTEISEKQLGQISQPQDTPQFHQTNPMQQPNFLQDQITQSHGALPLHQVPSNVSHKPNISNHSVPPHHPNHQNIFKVPSTPESAHNRISGLPYPMNDFNNPFRSPEANHTQQREFLQRSSQHPINTFANSEDPFQRPRSNPGSFSQGPSGNLAMMQPSERIPSPYQRPPSAGHVAQPGNMRLGHPSSFTDRNSPLCQRPLSAGQIGNTESMGMVNQSVNPERIPSPYQRPLSANHLSSFQGTAPGHPNPIFNNNLNQIPGSNAEQWPNAKRQCLSNTPLDMSNMEVNRKTPNQPQHHSFSPNNFVHNQNTGAMNNPFGISGAYSVPKNMKPEGSQHIPSYQDPFQDGRNKLLFSNENQRLPHNNLMENRANQQGSIGSVPPPSNLHPSLVLSPETSSKTLDPNSHPENRALSSSGSFPHSKPFATQDHHQQSQHPSMQKLADSLPHNVNEHSRDCDKTNVLNSQNLMYQHSMPNHPNIYNSELKQPNNYNNNLAFGNDSKTMLNKSDGFTQNSLGQFSGEFKMPMAPIGSLHQEPGSDFKPSVVKQTPEEPNERVLDPSVVHCQMEYNEESFYDPDVGGVAISLCHGSVLFEVAKRELHATTALKNPNKFQPTRISLVFYQHKNLNYPNHGFAEYEKKIEKLRLEKLEKRKESFENEVIPPELKMKKKKKEKEDEVDFATTSAAQYKYMWQVPTGRSEAFTTDSIITRWIDPQPMVTGPYQRWVTPPCKTEKPISEEATLKVTGIENVKL